MGLSLNKFLFIFFLFVFTDAFTQSNVDNDYNQKDYKNPDQFSHYNKRRKAVSKWQINQLKTGALMVRLKTNDKAIAYLKKEGKIDLATQKENTPANNIPSQKAETSFDDFSKMDIRVGTILEAERVPKTDKLLKLKIDTGIDVRTVVSGIAEWYKPEDIIGKKVSILVNLAPRKIKGIESMGMILMAENAQGELSFVIPTKDNSNDGSIIK